MELPLPEGDTDAVPHALCDAGPLALAVPHDEADGPSPLRDGNALTLPDGVGVRHELCDGSAGVGVRAAVADALLHDEGEDNADTVTVLDAQATADSVAEELALGHADAEGDPGAVAVSSGEADAVTQAEEHADAELDSDTDEVSDAADERDAAAERVAEELAHALQDCEPQEDAVSVAAPGVREAHTVLLPLSVGEGVFAGDDDCVAHGEGVGDPSAGEGDGEALPPALRDGEAVALPHAHAVGVALEEAPTDSVSDPVVDAHVLPEALGDALAVPAAPEGEVEALSDTLPVCVGVLDPEPDAVLAALLDGSAVTDACADSETTALGVVVGDKDTATDAVGGADALLGALADAQAVAGAVCDDEGDAPPDAVAH